MSLSRFEIHAVVYRARSAVLKLLTLWPLLLILALLPAPPKFRPFERPLPISTRNGFYLCLLASILFSLMLRQWGVAQARGWSSPVQVSRYRSAYLASALLSQVAALLGLALHWRYEPPFSALVPFFLASAALGMLSIPTIQRLDLDRTSAGQGDHQEP